VIEKKWEKKSGRKKVAEKKWEKKAGGKNFTIKI
jgi:hypothetical protein